MGKLSIIKYCFCSLKLAFFVSFVVSLLLLIMFSPSLGTILSPQTYILAIIYAAIATLIIDVIKQKSPKRLILILVFSFLYIPMLLLIIYSFNASRDVGVWSGFSIKWYFELFSNDALLATVGLSLAIAAISATVAVILGTLASYVIVRFRRFRGANLFSFMTTAPLVMPDVITGLALLLLFLAMGKLIGWPQERGAITICFAHITFCTAYVTVVVSARLRELDRSIEEAAMDLGANPLKVFFIITLPMIAPALISGWLLAFTLSMDDYVISSFVSGPGSTTLPMLIFSRVSKTGITPEINALATIILLMVGIIGFVSWLLMKNREKRRIAEMRVLNK